MTDGHGRVVIVHGTNMVYKLAPYYPAAIGFGNNDASFLRRIGFNAVRVGVVWKALEPTPGSFNDAYMGKIAATVRVLARHGIYSLLEFHQDMYNERFQGEGAPDWAVQDDGLPALPKQGFPQNYFDMVALWRAFDHFWSNSSAPGGVGLQDRFTAAWRHVARRFRGNRHVLGYELFNEPFPGTAYATCASPSGCPSFDATLTAFNRKLANAIRGVDHRRLVFYEPNVAFDFGYVTNVGSLAVRRAGFAFHDYCLMASSNGCTSESTTFSHALQHVAQTHEALLLTEFGATDQTGDLTGMVRQADRNMVPWLEWAYCGCNDPTTMAPGDKQAIVRDPAKAPTGSNLVPATLRVLVEPYPQLIAGTPLSWAFNAAQKTFRLRYTTARASGRGRFKKGSVTEIATPPLVYGGHYTVRVTGGAVVSRRGASVLQVASCPHARRVSVTVTPSSSHGHHNAGHNSCIAPLTGR